MKTKYFKISFTAPKGVEYIIDLDQKGRNDISIDIYSGDDEDAYSIGAICIENKLNIKTPKSCLEFLKKYIYSKDNCYGFSTLIGFNAEAEAYEFKEALASASKIKVLEVTRTNPKFTYKKYVI